MKILLGLMALLMVWGCHTAPTNRGVYVYIDPQMQANKSKLLETIEYIINDMSPKELLIIQSGADEILKMTFASTLEEAYAQKKSLKKSVRALLDQETHTSLAALDEVLQKAEDYLQHYAQELKSVIVAAPQAFMQTAKEASTSFAWMGFLDTPTVMSQQTGITLSSLDELEALLSIQ